MDDATADIARKREDEYFRRQDQQRLAEIRQAATREAEAARLMEVLGIPEREVLRELAEAGIDSEVYRLLCVVPAVEVAWADGNVSTREREELFRIAILYEIKESDAAHDRLLAWLTQRPPDQFFQACMRGLKAMLRHRAPTEAESLRRELAWNCSRVAAASGGFLGMGPAISREERRILQRVSAELDARGDSATEGIIEKLQRR